jgi:hypothetical protein
MILTDEQQSFLDQVVIDKWLVNSDTGLIDVDGDVGMSDMNLTEISVKFGNVTGYFNCGFNKLTSLVGAPQSVGGCFDCSYNKLTNFLNGLKSVGDDLICYNSQLVSLEGFPVSLGGFFHIDLSYIKQDYYHVIIPEIEEIIFKVIKIYNPRKYYSIQRSI